jgi:hypothetical protein
MDMIREDPNAVKDVQAFLDDVNEQRYSQTVKTETVVVTKSAMVSLAELNGGPATERDVSDALALLEQEPLKAEAQARFDKVQSAISSGEIMTLDEVADKLGEK